MRNTNTAVTAVQKNVEGINTDMERIHKRLDAMNLDREQVEMEVRKINLVVAGIVDEEKETDTLLRSKVQNLLNSIVTTENVNIDTVTRLGKFRPHHTRFILVRFASMRERNLVWDANIKKKTTPPAYINEDLPYSLRRTLNE